MERSELNCIFQQQRERELEPAQKEREITRACREREREREPCKKLELENLNSQGQFDWIHMDISNGQPSLSYKHMIQKMLSYSLYSVLRTWSNIELPEADETFRS